MLKNYLKNITSLEKDDFSKLMRHLGFATSAIYQLKNECFILILKARDEENWPAVVRSHEYYTAESRQIMHPGWLTTESRKQWGTPWLKEWPKGTYFYLPDQDLDTDKFMFTVSCASGKRVVSGEMSAPLEALANRLRSLVRSRTEREKTSESLLNFYLKSLGSDVHVAIDHELRNPLSSITGYLAYVRELLESQKNQESITYLKIIEAETKLALEALDRLSLTLGKSAFDEPVETVDLKKEIDDITQAATQRIVDLVGEGPAEMIRIRVHKFCDDTCEILAPQCSLWWSILEVLKNGIVFSKSGRIDVNLYKVDRMVVLDIEDDGLGVPPGSEDLIFMRFFQDLRHAQIRTGKRGSGIGLFLARKIAEQHLGHLQYLRQKSRSVFRFIWPESRNNRDLSEDKKTFQVHKFIR